MDYQKIAGDILFGGDVLDNAVRGEFIEALTFDALLRHDATLGQMRWHHIGKGWGPWDLQRGTAAAGDRVRFQVKTKASKQLWAQEKARHEYDLGHRTYKVVPKYFFRDFDQAVIGECEIRGYRADYFLLAWHECGPQSDPNTYAYFIVPVSDLPPTLAGPVKKIHIDAVKARKGHSFAELPRAINDAADAFLTGVRTPCET
jgi:hypothetical protein